MVEWQIIYDNTYIEVAFAESEDPKRENYIDVTSYADISKGNPLTYGTQTYLTNGKMYKEENRRL